MNKLALLREIINANNERQYAARELNRLAQKKIFPVLSEEEMYAFVKAALNGATSVSTIVDFEVLRLPPLDPALVAQVKNSNVTSIMLLGEGRSVDYSRDGDPSVSLFLDGHTAGLIVDLDDKGIFLPDGRQVSVEIRTSFRSNHKSKDIVALKKAMRSFAVNHMWMDWNSQVKPILPTPNVQDENSVIGEIALAQWGICPVTKEALNAYGTLRVVGDQFETMWFKELEDAEEARSTAVNALDALRRRDADAQLKRRKRQAYAEVAILLNEQLVVLDGEMINLAPGDKAVAAVKEHLRTFEQINGGKAKTTMTWIEQARAVVTAANRAIVRDTKVFQGVLDSLLDTIAAAPEGELQDFAMQSLLELSELISPTMNATTGAQKLMALRVSVCRAMNPQANCDDREVEAQAA